MTTIIDCKYVPNQALILEYLLLDTNPTPPPAYVVTDLAGADFVMMVRSQPDSKDILAEASITNGKIEIVSLEREQNGDVYLGDGLRITFSASDTLSIYQGTVLEYARGDLQATFPILASPINGLICLNLSPDIYSTRDYAINGECP